MPESSIKEDDKKRLCYYDQKTGIKIHVFGPAKCQCNCGERIVRKPTKVYSLHRLEFGNK